MTSSLRVGDTEDELRATAVDDSGTIYVLSTDGYIKTLDPVTLGLTSLFRVGSVNGTYVQSMTYDYNNDTIYWADPMGRLSEIDVENQKVTDIGTIGYSDGEVRSSLQTVSLFSVPKNVPEIPETVDAVGVTLSERDTVAVGGTVKLEHMILPVSVAEVEGDITWSSDNEEIAAVSDGTVTGVSAGEAVITAKVGNVERTCTVTVTEGQRSFYAYSENDSAWITFDGNGSDVEFVRKDQAGESPISAAFYTGDTIYAYTEDGQFWSVDPETFDRTLIGKGVSEERASLSAQDELGSIPYTEKVPYTVGDLTWDAKTNTLYGVMEAIHYSFIEDSFSSVIFKVNLDDGTVAERIVEGSSNEGERPVAILYHNDMIYQIDGFDSGMIYTVNVDTGERSVYNLLEEYWGDFNGGRGLIEDPLTGRIYGVRDLGSVYYTDFENWRDKGYDTNVSTCSELIELGMGTGLAKRDLCDIGDEIVVNSLFIK